MTKMNPEVKEEWVAALESGVYPQGKGKLTSLDGKYCCLGVLCKLYLKYHDDLSVSTNSDRVSYDGEGAYLPGKVAAWAGIVNFEDQTFLGDLNDGVGCNVSKNFFEIADHIRKNY